MSDHSSNRGSRRSRGAGRGNGQRGRGARVFFRNDQTADNGHSGMGQSRRSDVDGNQQGADQQNPRRQGTNNFHRGRGGSQIGSQDQSNHRGRGGSQSTRQPYQFFPITQNTLKKFAEENAEPSDIVKKFTEEDTGLKQFLKENSNKQDYCDSIELVLLVLGGFCQKNGVTEFGHGFIRIVKVLGEMGVFKIIANVVMQLPRSNAANALPKDQRLRNVIKSVHHLVKEMLVCMPAESCNWLGENFFADITDLQCLAHIRALNVSDAFHDLLDGTERLKTSWEQHGKTMNNKKSTAEENSKWNRRARYMELKSLMKPPDDFRQLRVMPEWEDVCTDIEPFLRPNVIKGNYPDVDTYLDVQFRLLREDFFSPLRDGLLSYIKKIQGKHKRGLRIDNIRLYEDVQILDQDAKTNNYTLQFSIKGMQRVNWEGSKRLLFGSLLLLSEDDFNSFFLFTVADRKPDQLSRGILKANFEGVSLPASVKKKKLVMAESSVFFEAYRSVLQALQKISPDHFPMKEYILGHDFTPAPPKYLVYDERPTYDLSSIPASFEISSNVTSNNTAQLYRMGFSASAVSRMISRVEILEPRDWPDSDMLGLDPSQAKALFAALTRKLVVIQGPPGTGKTYLGLKIVQALLHNRSYWVGILKPRPAPILVICYTNHALDQFLEGIMKFTKKIVRIGGQFKCEALKEYSLYEWKGKAIRERRRPAKYMHWIYENQAKLNSQKEQLGACRKALKMIETSGIVHEDTLLEFKIISKEMHTKLRVLKSLADRNPSVISSSLTDNSALPNWLGLESMQLLESLLKKLEKPKPVVQKKVTEPPPLATEDDLPEEDVWDKEDVDDIQGDRMLDDVHEIIEDAGSNGRAKNKENKAKLPDTSAHEKIRFGYSPAMLREKINFLQQESEELEVKGEQLNWYHLNIATLQKQLEMIEKVLQVALMMDTSDHVDLQLLMDRENLLSLDHVQRWKLYSHWKSSVAEVLNKEIGVWESACNSLANELKDIETIEVAEIIRGVDVIGITTTGAAKHRGLLEHLKSKIVVVEEAAEVLEAHIITSLSASCQHLILIGDHQQLRPSTTVYKLAKDYHLDVSLFERLILNGMEPCVLRIQHRMRPEVSRLIVPAIYPELQDHDSVHKYPEVPGMIENVFFLTHTEKEKGDQSDHDSRSHLNPYEADMAVGLARHLLMQGFDSSQITILTTYAGQLLHFKKMRRNHSALQGVRISVVDNFQGEENDIIILSLVRSNEDANIGFLKTENRICVALSRAKRGFYLIGNMDNLSGKSDLWSKISSVLAKNRQIGPSFGLKCGVHPYICSQVKQLCEFPPEGGCFIKCNTPMPCNHICQRICHIDDRDHTKQKCNQRCTRSCLVGHPCPKKCFEDCHPCLTKVSKILPCQHSQTTECFKDPETEYCLTKVVKALPNCNHSLKMDCGKEPSSVVCPNLCQMELDCSHICNLKCHKRSSHAEIKCRQPCRRTPCIEKHPCPKECFVDCGKCMVEVTKKLPCGHDGQVKCWVLPKDAYCSVKVERTLPNCQHTAIFDCSQSTAGYRCTLPCQKLLCLEGHICKKKCYEPCGVCNAQVERKLNCNHTIKIQCHLDPAKIKCRFPKSVVLPMCLHKVEIACSGSPEEAICPLPCDIRLDCGHQCTEKCHIKSDPHHEKYICKKVCSRNKLGCKENHKCGKKCHEPCDPCLIRVKRELDCSHSTMMECRENKEDIFCREKVTKIIEDCRHEIETMCSNTPTREDCDKSCNIKLPCSHQCRNKCSEECTSNCQELVPLTKTSFSFRSTKTSLCGHRLMAHCEEYQRTRSVTDEQIVQFLQECPELCREPLGCQHLCSGSCGICFNGRVHKACVEKCGRTLVCGHSCKVNCASSCPPCTEQCQYRCSHSKCSKKCCEPCTDCTEPCGWSCEHFKCTRKCWEFCNRPRCDKPCTKRLPCQHLCVGLCGEVCPPLCRVCNKEELTEFVLYGNEGDEDARFIYLEECKHSIEVEGMDHWMGMNQQEDAKEIQMKCCPRCKTIIRSCYRYGDIIKQNFQDIVKVKTKILTAGGDPKQFVEKLQAKVNTVLDLNNRLAEEFRHTHNISYVLAEGLQAIQESLKPRRGRDKLIFPSLHADQRYLYEVQIDVIERILDVMKNTPRVLPPSTSFNQLSRPQQYFTNPVTMKSEFMLDILDRAQRLVNLLFNRERFSENEHPSFITEIERLDLVRAYFMLKSAPTYKGNAIRLTKERKELRELLIKNVKKLTEKEKIVAKTALQTMGKILNTGLGISDEERQQIIRAIGLKQGHWYKCPNGHIYAIGECGGAMQESKCPECGAKIGGLNHGLTSGNAVAREMDGARYAAWSEEANNMANFQF